VSTHRHFHQRKAFGINASYNQFRAVALRANATLSFLNGRTEESACYHLVCRAVRDLGSTYLGIRFSIETIPPFLMAGARFVLAGMIMYAIAWSQGIGKSTWANWRTSFIIGACLLLGGNGGVTISEQYIDSGLAALIVAVVPIYIVLLGGPREWPPRPTPIMWMGLAGGLLGWESYSDRGLHLHSSGGRNPASEYRSCLSQVSFGRRARFTRALRNTQPHHFSLLLNK